MQLEFTKHLRILGRGLVNTFSTGIIECANIISVGPEKEEKKRTTNAVPT